MTAVRQPTFLLSIEDYLTISSLKVLIFVEPDEALVLLYRRSTPEGGFAVEEYGGTGAVIPLPEMDMEVQLAELYERVGLDFQVMKA